MLKNRKVSAVVFSLLFALIITASVLLGLFKSYIDLPVNDHSSASSGVSSGEVSSSDGESSSDSSGGTSSIPSGDILLPTNNVDTSAVELNIPDELRAVYIKAGVDFAKKADDTETRIRADIDSAFRSAKEMSLNTVLFDTLINDSSVVYESSNLPMYMENFDILDYAIKKAREYNLHIYAVVSPSLASDPDGKLIKSLSASPSALYETEKNFRSFAQTYNLDGIVINNYYYEEYELSYYYYILYGNGKGYEQFKHYVVEKNIETAAKAIKQTNNDILVVLYTDGVWLNKASDELGSNTTAAFEAYTDGYADTKKLAESGLFDAVMVEALGSMTAVTIPFKPIVSWWNEVAESRGLKLYVMHASSKACSTSTGWSSPDQLTKQLVEAKKYNRYGGSCFDSFSDLERNPGGSTTALIKYFDNEENDDLILKQLVITKPSKTEFTTTEPLVQFSGASAPLFDLFLNSTKIQTDASGMFSRELELNPGLNTFEFEHKGKKVVYKITREIDIIKDVSPIGAISVDGGDKITVSVWAYDGSTVRATLNSTTITLSVDDTVTDNTNLDSDYKLYTGSFTAPAATANYQSLGRISFSAYWDTLSDSALGATVTVNKKAELGSGRLVMISADEAETFPTGVINDYSHPDYFPLPKGTVDRIYGEEITYVEEGKTFKYYKLESGVRVYSKDITFINSGAVSDNSIKGLTVTADSSKTKVILDTASKVPFKASYDGTKITFKFSYTTSTPASLKLTKNPLFSAANWSGSTLTLMLFSNNCFMGFKSYYNSNNNLVLEFNNPALMQSANNKYGYTLNGTRIAIDSGHGGGNNPGAVGVHPSYPEATINQLITGFLKQELESIGATVYLIDSVTVDPSLESRVQQAKAFNAQMMISVHQNSALSSGATGSEAFYFNAYSKKLAESISSRVYSAVPTNNRGTKFGYYYVTRDAQFPATLVECGFISNSEEHYKLIQTSTQQAIAEAITQGIVAFAKATGGASSFATGTESVGTGSTNPPTDNSSSAGSSTSSESSGSSSGSSSDISSNSSGSSSEISDSQPYVKNPTESDVYVNKGEQTSIVVNRGEGDDRVNTVSVSVLAGNVQSCSISNPPVETSSIYGVGVTFSEPGVYVLKVTGKNSQSKEVLSKNIIYHVQ